MVREIAMSLWDLGDDMVEQSTSSADADKGKESTQPIIVTRDDSEAESSNSGEVGASETEEKNKTEEDSGEEGAAESEGAPRGNEEKEAEEASTEKKEMTTEEAKPAEGGGSEKEESTDATAEEKPSEQ